MLTAASRLTLDEATRRHLASGGRVLLDFSTEALVLSPLEHVFSRRLADLHRELHGLAVKPGQLVMLNANVASPAHYETWCAAMGLAPLLEVLAYDFYLYESVAGLKLRFAGGFDEPSRAHAEGMAVGRLRSDQLFSCLNLKAKAHRLAVAAFLEHLGIVDRCLVTLHGAPDELERLVEDSAALFADAGERSGVAAAARRLAARAPLRLDMDQAQIEANIYRPAYVPASWDHVLLLDPKHRQPSPLARSQVHVVTETWFTDASCLYLTEKTLLPLCMLKPFVVAGSPGALRRLRDLGFRTFSQAVDESYDEEVEPSRRMAALCHELRRIAGLDGTTRAALLAELWPAVVHNQAHLIAHGMRWGAEHLTRMNSRILSESGG
jgi:hypothetical protein